jgi:external thioesterase TEII
MLSHDIRYHRLCDQTVGVRLLREGQQGAPLLLGFPYAGGQSLAYRPLGRHLPDDWALWGVDPPGHGSSGGRPLRDVDTMVTRYLECLPIEGVTSAILVGHSFGGYAALALAHRLVEAGRRPRAVVLSATRPPQVRDSYESWMRLDDRTLLFTLIDRGAVPAAWADRPEFYGQFITALRADLEAAQAFQLPGPLEGVPVLVLSGRSDELCRAEHATEWEAWCPGCRIEALDGDHLFLTNNPRAMADALVPWVRGLIAPRVGSQT